MIATISDRRAAPVLMSAKDMIAATIMLKNPHSAVNMSIRSCFQPGPRVALNGCWIAIAPRRNATAIRPPPINEIWLELTDIPNNETVPVVRVAKVNPPVISAAKPIRVNAPTTAISVSAWTIAGIFMFRMLFEMYPSMNPIIAAIISAAMGAAAPNFVASNIAITPDPNAIIPADGTPVPIP